MVYRMQDALYGWNYLHLLDNFHISYTFRGWKVEWNEKKTSAMYISIILLHNWVLITMLNKSNDFLCEMYLNWYGDPNQVSVVQCPSRFPILIHNNFSS